MEKIFNSLLGEIDINGKNIKVFYKKVSLEDDILYLSTVYDRDGYSGVDISDRVLNHLVTKNIDRIKNYIGLDFKLTLFKKNDQ